MDKHLPGNNMLSYHFIGIVQIVKKHRWKEFKTLTLFQPLQ